MKNTFFHILNRYGAFRRKVPLIIGTEAVKFAKSNFRAQGFQGDNTEKWTARKRDPEKTKKRRRAILVQSGRLKQSIRITRISMEAVTIGSDVPYAQIHNEGSDNGTTVTESVRAHRRKMSNWDEHKLVKRGKTGKKSSRIRYAKSASGVTFVKAHSRTRTIKIPQRKFIGPSPILDRNIRIAVTSALIDVFR
jgi:phage gpG-like protein